MAQRAYGIALPPWLMWAWLLFRLTRFMVRITFRYVAGRPMNGVHRTDAGWFREGTTAVNPETRAPLEHVRVSGWAMLPFWKRAAWRIGVPAALYALLAAYLAHPTLMRALAVLVALVLVVRGLRAVRRAWRSRRFRRVYVRPLAAVLGPLLKTSHLPAGRWLTVSPDLGDLTPRLAKPMSEVETRIRTWYGVRVEPIVRWFPDWCMRGYWWAYERTAPARVATIDRLKRPTEAQGPRVEIHAAPNVWIDEETKKKINTMVYAKLGMADLEPSWNQIGETAACTWTLRERPPGKVGFKDIADLFDAVKDHEFVTGLKAGGRPHIVNLETDSPHIACSAASGAGKTVLAMMFAIAVLRRGGEVLFIDPKGSHRWARGLPGVTYCIDAEDMHSALIGKAELSMERNREAFIQPDGWDPGPRHLVVFEEMNMAVSMLKDYWEGIKPKGAKGSPAIAAFRQLMFAGRSAKVHLFGVAQMLSANTTGGPETRENFAVRFLARYTANNWKMLAPECPMPRKSMTQGRWQCVVGGEATEVQVAYLRDHEARQLVFETRAPERLAEIGVPIPAPRPATNLDQDGPDGTAGQRDSAPAPDPAEIPDPMLESITLHEAIERGILVGKYETLKKQIQRAQEKHSPHAPRPVGNRGRANLFRIQDLVEWSESVTAAK